SKTQDCRARSLIACRSICCLRMVDSRSLLSVTCHATSPSLSTIKGFIHKCSSIGAPELRGKRESSVPPPIFFDRKARGVYRIFFAANRPSAAKAGVAGKGLKGG